MSGARRPRAGRNPGRGFSGAASLMSRPRDVAPLFVLVNTPTHLLGHLDTVDPSPVGLVWTHGGGFSGRQLSELEE